MLKIAVCDDNESFLETLKKIISESARDYFKDINVQCFNNGQRLLNQHKCLFFDVIFLDIDMPEFTGFDVAEILRKQRRDCYIIFVTNHNELVYGSMEFQPFYFIQKSSVSRLNKDVVNVLNKLCNGVQREHNKKLNNGLPILHKVPPKRDYGRYFCIMAEKGGTSHGGLTEKLSLFFHAKKQEVNAYGR